MGRLSTHVLDIAKGKPASGVAIELFRIDASGQAERVASARTNADGRTDQPLLEGAAFTPGIYELRFAVGAYFKGQDSPPFLDVVPVRFAMGEGHYHVPLLCSPWSYSTYRGS